MKKISIKNKLVSTLGLGVLLSITAQAWAATDRAQLELSLDSSCSQPIVYDKNQNLSFSCPMSEDDANLNKLKNKGAWGGSDN